jgi:hypothetical protein
MSKGHDIPVMIALADESIDPTMIAAAFSYFS